MIDVVWNDDQVVNFHFPSTFFTHLALCYSLRICNDEKDDNDEGDDDQDDKMHKQVPQIKTIRFSFQSKC